MRTYTDRDSAGRELAGELARLRLRSPVVLALPRGGVPVGRAIAAELDAPLDVLLVRKIGAPGHRELGVGAVGEDDVTVLDHDRIDALGIDRAAVAAIAQEERAELARRAELYRGGRPLVDLAGRDAIVVDDGIATGGTAVAAVEVVRHHDPAQVVVAVPVGADSGLARLAAVADRVVCPLSVSGPFAVGSWYRDFHQLDDDEVADLLR
jgi:putative phosphoribosyl transferase